MSELSKPPVRFIRDEPAEEDFFNTHTKLAGAISRALKGNPELRTVGILGPWGSGKSTVLHHLKSLLSADGYVVFSYDAWVYQSEPVRRSFLESLIRFLIANKLATEDAWRDEVNSLKGTTTQTETTPVPSLTRNAGWILLSALLVPPGLALLDLDTIKEAFGARTTLAGIWTLRLAILMVLAPFIVLSFRYLITRPFRSAQSVTDFFKWNRTGKPSDDLFAIFLRRSVETTRSTTLHSPDPTAIEFADAFRKVMRAIDAKEKRIVFIIDNLDRVVVEDAIKIWSTIRSFFLTPALEHDHTVGSSHPLVFLPLDDSAIERLFDGSSQSSDLGTSLLNKTFDVTFRVTPPVMSDWKAFLHRQLVFSLDDRAGDSLLFWTPIFFEEWKIENTARVTPREINKFVNSLAALAIQWEDEDIPLVSLAYFAAASSDIGKNILDFIRSAPSVVPPSERWQLEIAAVYFGVPLDKAAQVLLNEEIEQAITDGNEQTFADYRNVPGFYDSVRSTLQRTPELARRTPNPLEWITNAASYVSKYPPEDPSWRDEAWTSLTNAYLAIESRKLNVSNVAGRLEVFLPNLTTANRATFLQETAAAIGNELVEAGDDAALDLGHLMILLQNAQEQAGLPEIQAILPTDVGGIVIDVVLQLQTVPKAIRTLRSNCSMESFTESLAQLLEDEETAVSAKETVALVLSSGATNLISGGSDKKWDQFVQSCLDAVRQHAENPYIADEALEAFTSLVPHSELARQSIAPLANEGVLTKRAGQAYADGSETTLRDALALQISSQVPFSAPSGSYWRRVVQERPDLPKQVLHRLREMHGATSIHLVWDSYDKGYSQRTFLEDIVSYAIKNRDLGRLHVDKILSNLGYYTRTVSWRQEGLFLDIIQDYTTFWDNFRGLKLDESAETLASILDKRESVKGQKIRDALHAKIEALSTEEWSEVIKSGNNTYGAVVATPDRSLLSFKKHSNLHSALLAQIPYVISGNADATKRWMELAGLLSVRTKKAAVEKFASELLSGAAGKHLLVTLRAGGQQILDVGGFAREPDRAIESILLVLAASAKGREWLKDHIREVRGWMTKASKKSRQQVHDMLLKMQKSGSEDRRYWAEFVSNELGMR